MIRIPFEGAQIVGYFRKPKGVSGPVPVVLAIAGLDSRKETVAETYAELLPHGVAFFAIDSPGTVPTWTSGTMTATGRTGSPRTAGFTCRCGATQRL